MKPADRKAALARYRERKPQLGVFALRCAATGQCWVGSSTTLDTVQNRHRFTLSQGSHPNAALQRAATAHGVEAIGFELLERLDPDTPDVARDRVLRDRLAHWVSALPAERL